MATWTTDIAGTGLAHARLPTPKEILTQRQIARRWSEWQPLLIHELRQRNQEVFSELARMKRIHDQAMRQILGNEIPYKNIVLDRPVKLDDPRIRDEQRDVMIAEVVRRSKARKGANRAIK